MASERNTLPGGPSQRLIKHVRQVLRIYMGCRPQRESRVWREAWEWALRVAHRSMLYLPGKRTRWPSSNEIATQYILLCLAEMKSSHSLRLPFNAMKFAPPGLAALTLVPWEDLPKIGHVPEVLDAN